MDLNRLFFDHQLALLRASASECPGERDLHNADADGIATRISAFQRSQGASAAPLMPAAAL